MNLFCFGVWSLAAFCLISPSRTFSTARTSTIRWPRAITKGSRFFSFGVVPSPTGSSFSSPCVSVESYEHNGWNLTYRYKPASKGYEKKTAILLIHPVGIGLSSWFWERVMKEWTGPDVYAPNLIGCGIQDGSDAWDPDERGLSFPLGWVKGVETLMQTVLSSSQPALSISGNYKPASYIVVAQGGLAPVGVLLAARNPDQVQQLVLASPPTWKDMTTPVPQSELDQNYNFFRSPILGKLAFGVLESRWAVEFFSNQFLFSEPCDADWLDFAMAEACIDARPPVMAFNSGFCVHRSFQEELCKLDQPTLILEGQDDKRPRHEYVERMRNCRLIRLPGQNVLPWESPKQVVDAILDII
jgi:pimeloyl-ACP methyl ester carboxylesterase